MADNTVHKGILKTWKDDRGFGFIQPDGGDKDIFIHISSLKGMARRPQRGDVIVYRVAREADGKLKAVDASIEGVAYQATPSKPVKIWRWLVALLLGLISAAAAAYFYR
ncbi:cold shock domain-containing protein [Methylomonas sp. SURF-1]|uniref:Cold shock domain-containing protein n=1 Tax=Methylomonas aurea TaxID=2952224 RepID=A0ABT1UJ11_9GAMM|nr:cold shock domain-containing protein [Methylomonas sp. SURF-1]MCQ8181818.1 cold shock domain-containing protein [Methylomonas sp. SURF-1]